jgi:hypothetical protein
MPGEALDQIFVRAKGGILSLLSGAPEWLVQIV